MDGEGYGAEFGAEIDGADFEADSLESGDDEEMNENEREEMIDDLRSIWEAHKKGEDLAQVLEVMTEVASRPSSARPSTGRPGSARPNSALRPDLIFGEDDPVQDPPATSSLRPASSLGLRPDSATVMVGRPPTSSGRPMSTANDMSQEECRPRTACDSGSRMEAMRKVVVTPVPVFKMKAANHGGVVTHPGSRPATGLSTRPRSARPASGLSATPRAVTPRGIGALFTKYHGDDPPRTPFTAREGSAGAASQNDSRPMTGRHRPDHTGRDDLLLAQAVQEGDIDEGILETDALPDAPGTEEHSGGVDVWIRDDEAGEAAEAVPEMPFPAEVVEEDEEESVAGLVAEIQRLDLAGIRPQTGSRIATAAAEEQGDVAWGAAVDSGCQVMSARLSVWLNTEAGEAGEAGEAAVEPEAPDGEAEEDIVFENDAMRALLLGEGEAASTAAVKAHGNQALLGEPGPPAPSEAEQVVAEMDAVAASVSFLASLGDAEWRPATSRSIKGTSKTEAKSRPSSRGVVVDCTSGGVVQRRPGSAGRQATPQPKDTSKKKDVSRVAVGNEQSRKSSSKPPRPRSGTGSSVVQPSRKQNIPDSGPSKAKPSTRSTSNENDKPNGKPGSPHGQPPDEDTVTAANEHLLSDMLVDTASPATNHTQRMRREVRSHRSRDVSPDDMRPGSSSRDIGEETRLRAQQIIDADRARTREGTLRSTSQRPRVH